MQAVILAAGRGTRMGQFTENIPKPLLLAAGKTLLEHKFDALPPEIDEIVLVIGYLGHLIRARYGDSYAGKRVRYVEQKDLSTGTAGALWEAREVLAGRFLVMMGDDIYGSADMERCLAFEWAIGVCKTDTPSSGARIIVDKNDEVLNVIESGPEGSEGLINAAIYALDTRVFDLTPVPRASGSSELGLPQTLLTADIPLHAVPIELWIPITAPEDLEKAAQILARRRA